MANGATPSVERLLTESVWLNGLARSLLGRDEEAAEDVAQEARLAALQSAPKDPDHARAWLARVARNFALRAQLRRTRRERRERAAASPEALPSTLELVARVNAQKKVAEAVITLDEPYRSAVLLRYFDALTAHDIAEKQGIPIETVRTRLKRALAQLRERLDGDFGSRGAWAALLLPRTLPVGVPATAPVAKAASAKAAAGAGAATVVGAGVVTMSVLTKSAIAVACVVAAAVGWRLLSDREQAKAARTAQLEAVRSDRDAVPGPGGVTTAAAERSASSVATRSSESTAAESSEVGLPATVSRRITATVLSAADDHPIAGAELRITTMEFTEANISETVLASARCDADGHVAAILPANAPLRPTWEVFADGYVPGGGWLFEVPPALGRHDLGTVKLARGTRVRGRVVRAADLRPVAGAELRFDRLSRGSLWRLECVRPGGTSAVDGSFTLLERVSVPPQEPWPLIALSEEGLGIGVMRVPAGAEELDGVDVVVGPMARLTVAIRDETGAPVGGARVCCIPRFSPFSSAQFRDGLQEFLTFRDARLATIFDATSDPAGVATFDRLPVAPAKSDLPTREVIESRYTVAALADGHEYGSCGGIRLDPSAPSNCVVVVPRTRLVSVVGRVTASDGVPIPGAAIDAWANPSRFQATTDEQGEFRVDGLPTSTKGFYLQVTSPGRVKFEKGFEFASLAAVPLLDAQGVSIEARHVEIVLERMARISGRLIDEEGAPIAGAKVSYERSKDGVILLGPIDVETPGSDEQGRFGHDVTESEWTVIACAPLDDGTFGPSATRVVKGGATDLVITCVTRPARAATLTCDVVDAVSGAPAPVASADVDPAEGFVGDWYVWKRVGLGSVVARGLFAGRWRVDVTLADHRRASQEFEVANDRDEVRVRLEVGMPARVVGRVDQVPESDGSPRHRPGLFWNPSDARLVDADGRILPVAQPASATLADDRRFILDGFVPGRTAIVFFTDFDRFYDAVVFTPARDEVREVVLRPRPAAHVALTTTVDLSKGWLYVEFKMDDEPWHREFTLIHRDSDEKEPAHTIRPGHHRWRAFFHADSVADEPPQVTIAGGEFDVAAGETCELRIIGLR